MNDIFSLNLQGKIILFADDAAISYSSDNLSKLNEMINQDMIALFNWFVANKLTLNLKKSKCMIFHPLQKTKKFKLSVSLNGDALEQVTSFEYLGLSLQDDLRWDSHIDRICSKISSVAGVFNRIGNNVDKTTLIFIYYAHVNSHLSYMSPIWGNSATQLLTNALHVIQNQAIRAIFRNDYYAIGLSTDEIRKKYNILTVAQSVKFNTAMLAFKIKKGIIKSNIELNIVGNVRPYATRNVRDMYQQSYRTNAGKSITSRLVAIEFNKLPNNIKIIQSLHTFKKLVKTFIINS